MKKTEATKQIAKTRLCEDFPFQNLLTGYEEKSFTSDSRDASVNVAFKNLIFGKITSILRECDQVKDSNSRLLIQACCLDVIVEVENFIRNN